LKTVKTSIHSTRETWQSDELLRFPRRIRAKDKSARAFRIRAESRTVKKLYYLYKKIDIK